MAPPVPKLAEQATAAFLYGTTSLIILSFNKLVLTVYGFPSFPVIALAQFIVTVIIIDVLRLLNYISCVPGSRPHCPQARPHGRLTVPRRAGLMAVGGAGPPASRAPAATCSATSSPCPSSFC